MKLQRIPTHTQIIITRLSESEIGKKSELKTQKTDPKHHRLAKADLKGHRGLTNYAGRKRFYDFFCTSHGSDMNFPSSVSVL